MIGLNKVVVQGGFGFCWFLLMRLILLILLASSSALLMGCVKPLHPSFGPQPHLDWLREKTEPEEYSYKLQETPFVTDSSLYLIIGNDSALDKRFVKCSFSPAAETIYLSGAASNPIIKAGISECDFIERLPTASEQRGKLVFSHEYYPDPGMVDKDVERSCLLLKSIKQEKEAPPAFVVISDELGVRQKRGLLCLPDPADPTNTTILAIPLDIPGRGSISQKVARGVLYPVALTADGVRIVTKLLVALPTLLGTTYLYLTSDRWM